MVGAAKRDSLLSGIALFRNQTDGKDTVLQLALLFY